MSLILIASRIFLCLRHLYCKYDFIYTRESRKLNGDLVYPKSDLGAREKMYINNMNFT
jgi:hypothetical protein